MDVFHLLDSDFLVKNDLVVRSLQEEDESFLKQFRQWLSANSRTAQLYTFALTHPVTLTYMVLFGGMLQEWQHLAVLSLLTPPLVFACVIHIRLRFTNTPGQNGTSQFTKESTTRRTYVAVENNNIIATMACDRKDGQTAVVKHMCAQAHHQCQKIVQSLLDKTLEFCKEEHYQKVWVQFTNIQKQPLGPTLCKNYGFKWLKDETLLTILPGVSLRMATFSWRI